jgi:hypothetical protein
MKAEASDNAEKRRRNHWDVFIIWANVKGLPPAIGGYPSTWGLRVDHSR